MRVRTSSQLRSQLILENKTVWGQPIRRAAARLGEKLHAARPTCTPKDTCRGLGNYQRNKIRLIIKLNKLRLHFIDRGQLDDPLA